MNEWMWKNKYTTWKISAYVVPKEGESVIEAAKEYTARGKKPVEWNGLEIKSKESFQKSVQFALDAAERE